MGRCDEEVVFSWSCGIAFSVCTEACVREAEEVPCWSFELDLHSDCWCLHLRSIMRYHEVSLRRRHRQDSYIVPKVCLNSATPTFSRHVRTCALLNSIRLTGGSSLKTRDASGLLSLPQARAQACTLPSVALFQSCAHARVQSTRIHTYGVVFKLVDQ